MARDRYNPCPDGIHVCGISGDEEEFISVANVVGVGEGTFAMLKTLFALPEGEDPDLVVDLMVGGDCIRDFGIRRQQLDALLKSCDSPS